jgi:hypothetical protein
MPMATPEEQREYQRKWIAARRAKWFSDKRCVDCGTKDELQLDHVDRKLKISHNIWSWSWQRIATETVKCVVRCRPCHIKKSLLYEEAGGNYKITRQIVEEIRRKYNTTSILQKDLGIQYGLSKSQISRIVNDEQWV